MHWESRPAQGPKTNGFTLLWKIGFTSLLQWLSFKPILHYAFGLRFGNVCEHKCEKNEKKNANGSRFQPTHSVI